MELELVQLIGSFPFVFKNEMYESNSLAVNKYCHKRCKTRECISLSKSQSKPTEFICHKGYNCVPFLFNDQLFMTFGIILNDNNVIKQGTIGIKPEYLTTREKLFSEIDKLNTLHSLTNQAIIKNFSLFHDVKSSNAIAYRIVEDYIISQSGSVFHEKLDSVDQEIKDLYDAIELVAKQLEIIDIMVNPEIPSKSDTIDANLFKLIHKLKKLFNRRAHKEDITLNVEGFDTIPNGKYKDVIILVPIILIENAIKYSDKNTTVQIELSRKESKNLISVSSFGMVVPKKEEISIFEKFQRGTNTKNYTARGMGMGLWVANNILKLHGSQLNYRNKDVNQKTNKGMNIFEFTID